MHIKSEIFIQRCFDLARLGMGKVAPNPIVGSVIATSNKIFGEGYHKCYGKAHAEVMAVESALKKKNNNFENATIYVSLEPCNFHNNTPPCSELIIKHKIPSVAISAIDKTEQVNFSGIQKLKENGHKVKHNICLHKGKFVSRIRNTFASKKRPYIILKFAESADKFMGKPDEQVWLSNSYSKRLTHRWRSEVSAILVGTNTIITDNPELNTRYYTGDSPLRIGIDLNDKISRSSKIKNQSADSWIYTLKEKLDTENIKYKTANDKSTLLNQICIDLYDSKCSTLLVEGGASLINSFVKEGLWDEARIIHTPKILGKGIKSPQIEGNTIAKFPISNDKIELILSPNNVIYS